MPNDHDDNTEPHRRHPDGWGARPMPATSAAWAEYEALQEDEAKERTRRGSASRTLPHARAWGFR